MATGQKEKLYEIFRDISDQFFSNGDFAIPLAGYVDEVIREKLIEAALVATLPIVANANTVLLDENYNVVATQQNIVITLPAQVSDNTLVRISNDSGGQITVNGNGKQIYDTGVFDLFDGESLILFFLNDKWNLA